MNIFITGINGFVGSYLAKALINNFPKARLYGLVRSNPKDLRIDQRINKKYLFKGDILDYQRISLLIKKIKPDWVFHLAAKVSPRYVKELSESVFEINFIGTFNLLKALKKNSPRSKIFIASTAAVYGNVSDESLPIKETLATNAVDAYGASKACAEILSKQYYNNFNLNIIIARTFNFLAPAGGNTFVEKNFLPQIKLIKEGKNKVFKTGDLNTCRDFLDVRDGVEAYLKLMKRGKPGEIYNICSNKGVSTKYILDLLLKKTGFKNKIKIIRDPKLVRSIDIKKSFGDNAKIISQTDWHPKISIEKTIQELLENNGL